MSGICGVVALDENLPTTSQLQAMLSRLERRGPDGTSSWIGGRAALGHASLATTPEAETEELPLSLSQCTITADARLDNRAELLANLHLSETEKCVGDGELILRSYLKWAGNCVDHLIGDFAFAIWDARAGRLFCARDQMGMRQLIYCHMPDRAFVFATEARALLMHSAVPCRVNEGRIADFLHTTGGNLEAIDHTSTFFDDVFRLPPAHSLTVDERGLSLRRYWELTPGPELRLESDDAYAQAFLEVFTEAVQCRLRSAGPVGSMLSGGMDSSSIVAVASRLLAADGRGPLLTFSAVGPDSETCIETRTIYEALALPTIEPHLICHSDLGGESNELIRLTQWIDEPFDGDMMLPRAVYLTAHRRGVKVLLDGVSGDVALTSGNVLVRLLKRGNVMAAAREAAAEERFWGPTYPSWKALLSAAWHAWVPRPVRLLRSHLLWRTRHSNFDREALLSPQFAKKVGLITRRSRMRQFELANIRNDAEHRTRAIQSPILTAGRERYDRVASALAIEPRDPFLDVRVIQFCLSLPYDQLQKDGWPKMILRRAMIGRLPAAVVWRRGKQHLGGHFIRSVFNAWAGSRQEVLSQRERLIQYTDLFSRKSLSPDEEGLDSEVEPHLVYLAAWAGRQPVHRSG